MCKRRCATRSDGRGQFGRRGEVVSGGYGHAQVGKEGARTVGRKRPSQRPFLRWYPAPQRFSFCPSLALFRAFLLAANRRGGFVGALR